MPTDDDTAHTSTIHNYLIVDWKQETTRTRATEPSASDLGTNEIATEIHLDVVVPEVDVDELRARIEVPKPRVEATKLADVDTDGVADWRDVADKHLDEFCERHDATATGAWREEQDRIALQVLEDAPDRPDVSDVRRYLTQGMKRRREAVTAE